MSNNKTAASSPTISLPEGGGAIKGIGETFQPDLFTGTGNFSVPIFTSPGRNDFGPKLALNYSTGNGNGPFGLGWQLSIPRVTRKTEKGLPRYTKDDVFVLSNTEDLVPVLDGAGNLIPIPDQGDYEITRFCPRAEGLFARIEKWSNKNNTSDRWWRVVTKENVTSIFGRTPKSRIVDPSNNEHIFEWLLEETFDAKGNHILYEYAKDDPSMRLNSIHEQNRQYNQLYIRKIYYGTIPDGDGTIGVLRTATDHNQSTQLLDRRYAFEVFFDYRNWEIPQDYVHPDPQDQNFQELFDSTVSVREDPFSSFRSGFEIRTMRRCRRVLMVHHFTELGSPTVVKSTDFTYDHNTATGIQLLSEVTITGYKKNAGSYLSDTFPPVTFRYSAFVPGQQHYQSVEVDGNDFPPFSLVDPNVTLMDIYGDGLPDLLQTTRADYYHWRNLGKATFGRRHTQYGQSHPDHRPAGVVLADPGVAIGDTGGDGLPDLIIDQPGFCGFYEASPDGNWKNFKPFKIMLESILSDPNTRLVDLTGDGRSDILNTREHYFMWFRSLGEEGYAKPEIVLRKHDIDEFPDIFFNDSSGRVRLADMTGDGLSDIVLVHNGRIDYWPNMGYGRFGKRITPGNAPQLERDFDPRRLFFVDLNGTGCTDLVYVDSGRVLFWFNHSGNRWSDMEQINGTPQVTDTSGIQFADIFGTGTACLVWSYDYAQQQGGNYKVLDFCGAKKPHLLTEMSNNMGATTKVQYASSVKFYLEDKKNGNPWATNLPFPVHVLEKTEVIDHLSKTKLVSTYKYHHGYYSGSEREFRGFGRVDRFDTETFDDFRQNSLHVGEDLFKNGNRVFHVPPIETRTWFHTGVYFDENNISPSGDFYNHNDLMEAYAKEFYAGDTNAFDLNGSTVENGGDFHEAHRALRGSILRTEIFSLDGTANEEHPYAVTDNRYKVTALQDCVKENGKSKYHGVYLNKQKEIINYHYERNPDDPRITHTINIEHDHYGNLGETIVISYPRRIPLTDDSSLAYPDQAVTKAVYTFNRFINEDSSDDHYHIGIPFEVKVFEVYGLPYQPPAGSNAVPIVIQDIEPVRGRNNYIPYEDVPTGGLLCKRIIDWKRVYFRSNSDPDIIDPLGNLSHRLEFGTMESRALPYESYQAAFTRQYINTQLSPAPSEVFLTDDCGYHRELTGEPGPEPDNTLGDYWWIPSGRKAFDETAYYLPHRVQDPFGNTTITTFDGYGLLTTQVEDAAGNLTSAENDYRVLQPYRTIDPNDNSSQVVFDTLGMVVGTAVWGPDSMGNLCGDSLTGFNSDPTEAYKRQVLNDPLFNPHATLASATTALIYDLKRFQQDGTPAVVYMLAREEHASTASGNSCRIQHTFIYTDGFGRELQTKMLAESGPIHDSEGNITTTNTDPRWVGTGTKIYNNKGNPVREYEPFFSDTHACGIEQHGVSPTLCYDPLGRIICKLHPNHSYEKTVFDAWKQQVWDVNDTLNPTQRFDTTAFDPGNPVYPDHTFNPVDDPHVGHFFSALSESDYFPTWYDTNMSSADVLDREAAQKASRHVSTPEIIHLDNLGRPFLTIADNGKDENGSELYYQTKMVLDIEGNDLSITDPRGMTAFVHSFDIAGRKLAVSSADAGSKQIFPSVDNLPVYAWDAKGQRLHTEYDVLRRPILVYAEEGARTRLVNHIHYGDEPGVVNAKRYNLRGKIHSIEDDAGAATNSVYDFKGNLLESTRELLADYTLTVDWNSNPQPVLEGNEYLTTSTYDALNRVVEATAPDNTVHFHLYNQRGLLTETRIQRQGEAHPRHFVKSIEYNAKGQRELIQFGNGTPENPGVPGEVHDGVHIRYTYESETFRLKSAVSYKSGGTKLQDLSYVYDAVGNIVSIKDSVVQTIFHGGQQIEPICKYTYDPLYRLICMQGREHIALTPCHYQKKEKRFSEIPRLVSQPINNAEAVANYSEKYTYDPGGNLTQIKHIGFNSWTRNQSYDNASNRLETSIASNDTTGNSFCDNTIACHPENGFTFLPGNTDENGNIKKMIHLDTLEWDHANRLVKVVTNFFSDVVQDTLYYTYNMSGKRLRKVIERGGVRVEERVYIGGYEVYRKYNGSSAPYFERSTTHIKDDSKRIALVETKILDEHGDDDGPPIRVRFQLDNHLESSLLEVDEMEKVVSYEEYYPYGGTAYIAGENETEVKLKRYRYSGKERDEKTGLYYYGARYYAPWLGRWISPDPAGMMDGTNLYMFVRGSPIMLNDHNGYQAQPDTDSASPVANVEPALSANDIADHINSTYPGVTATVTGVNTIRVMLNDVDSVREGIADSMQSGDDNCIVIDRKGIRNYCRNNRALCQNSGANDKLAHKKYRMRTSLPESVPLEVEFRLFENFPMEVDEVYQRETWEVFASTILNGRPVLMGIQIPNYQHHNIPINEGTTDHFPVGIGFEMVLSENHGEQILTTSSLFAVDNWVAQNEMLEFHAQDRGQRAIISRHTRYHRNAQVTHIRLWESQIPVLQNSSYSAYRNYFCQETRRYWRRLGYSRFGSVTGRYKSPGGPDLPNGLVWCDVTQDPLRLR